MDIAAIRRLLLQSFDCWVSPLVHPNLQELCVKITI